ncbi:putative lipoprotein [Bacteroides sp. CAG:1076]|jgi:hypothetical protein|uniref:glycoside hydrolase family 18 n=1 Tax=Phocaeicola sp. TaxID=2773926 RepID=UPI00033731E0|nr:putative lipoprotein [Bacteroides sp. CAG:1076]
MKNIIKSALGLLVMGSLSMASCTDVESLDINRPTAQEQNPEAYANYLQSLRDYKNAEHKIVYAWFDNSTKVPASPAQHMTNIPDSVDIVALMYPEALADFEKSDIETMHSKGSKVVYTISYDDIKTTWEDQQAVAGTEGSAADFNAYLQSELDKQLAYSSSFDGVIVKFVGQDPTFMNTAEKEAYTTTQNIVLTAVKNWKTENQDKLLTWQGKPQNLTDKTILNDCEHIILDIDKVTDTNQLLLIVKSALTEGVPTDNIVIAVSTTGADTSDKKTGYWDTDVRALSEVAYWVAAGYPETDGFTRAGIAIYNVQNDYYATGGTYTYVKEAINILNPAPTK